MTNEQLQKIQDFIWKKCGSPTQGIATGLTEKGNTWIATNYPIEIGLAHVLNTLDKIEDKNFDFCRASIFEACFYSNNSLFICNWKLLNNDSIEANLRDQSPETQLAIAKLLGWEGE